MNFIRRSWNFIKTTWKRIPNKGPWFLSILTIVAALAAIYYAPDSDLDSIGSIFAAAAGFIAIIWFYNGLQLQTKQLEEQREQLQLQTKQLEEQREQFQLEFNNLKMESKRSAMLASRDILVDMEKTVVAKLGGEIETMPTLFTSFLQYLNPITRSDDPDIVLDANQKISLFLVPARRFMYDMREAGRCVLENEGFSFINTDLKTALAGAPENYIRANYEHLMYRPFISKYIGTAKMLADLMAGFNLNLIDQAALAAMELKNQKSGLGRMITKEAIQNMREINERFKLPIIEKYLATIKEDE